MSPVTSSFASSMAWARAHLLRDGLASVVVFLVALPLCVGVAIASGVPPERGLVTGIIGGLVVGALAGAPLQVSGPAAGLAVIVWQIVDEHGLAVLGPVVLIAGAAQLVAGLLRVGGWFRAVSPGVILGMLAGIGVLIAAAQVHVLVDDKPRGSGLLNLASLPDAVVKGAVPMDGSPHHLAALVGLTTIGVIALWARFAPVRLKLVPAPLVGVVAGALLANVAGFDIRTVDVPDDLTSALAPPTLTALWAALSSPAVIGAALALAAIASAETLLCASAVDRMHDGARTDYDKELRAQGIGNVLCGLVGALPMTGVIVRSSANVAAGAKTRASAILHGVLLLAFVALLPWVLERISMAALAAVLVYTGIKLAHPAQFVALAKKSKAELAVALVTLVVVVGVDLLTGVLAGFALSVLLFAVRLARVHVDVEHSGDALRARVHGIASFLNVPRLAKVLDALPAAPAMVVDLKSAVLIDPAAREVLDDWAARHRRAGRTVDVDWHH